MLAARNRWQPSTSLRRALAEASTSPTGLECARCLAGVAGFAERARWRLFCGFVLLVIVATGNHFFLDAAAGALVAVLAATACAHHTTGRYRPAQSGSSTAQAAASGGRAGGISMTGRSSRRRRWIVTVSRITTSKHGGLTRRHHQRCEGGSDGYRESPDSPLARVRRAGCFVLHDDRRSHDRQCCVADDRSRAPFLRVEPAVGCDRLRADLRRLLAARGSRRRSARAATDPHARPGYLHGCIAGRRAGHKRRLPDRDARTAGLRCRRCLAGGAFDRDEHVRRRRRAQQGAWAVGRHRGRGGRRSA
jgi:hypothetical protein